LEPKQLTELDKFDDLLETEVSKAPHLSSVTDFAQELTSKSNLDDALKIKSLSLSTLARLKKKVFY
jgi:hypothetical protein